MSDNVKQKQILKFTEYSESRQYEGLEFLKRIETRGRLMSQSFPEEKDPKTIFHYTSAQTAGLILSTMKLRMSPYGKSNDPFENQDKWFMNFSSTSIDQTVDELDIHEKESELLNKSISKNSRIISFSKCSKDPYHPLYRDGYRHGYQLPGMWSHYGNNHKGICLQLDFEKLKEENSNFFYNSETSFWDSVAYGLERRPSHTMGKYIEILFHKNPDYSTEREFRILDFDEEFTDDYRYLTIQESLIRIICGVDCSKVVIDFLTRVFGDKCFPLKYEKVGNEYNIKTDKCLCEVKERG